MSAEEVLRYVGELLGDARRQAHTNGTRWPVSLESAWLLANSGHLRPGLRQRAGSTDSRRMVLDFADAGVRLGVSERTVRRLVRSGELRAVTVGGSPRVRVADLAAYVDHLPTHRPGAQQAEADAGPAPGSLSPGAGAGPMARDAA